VTRSLVPVHPADVSVARASGRSGSWALLRESLQSRSVVSIDVFDTTLTRACGPPEALFLWLGRRLAQEGQISCSPEVFARARARADRMVWQRAGGMDSNVSLEDFHHEVVRLLNLDPELVGTLVAAEEGLEAEVLRALPGTAQAVGKAGEQARQVVFTSDTYFTAAFVEQQLRRNDVWTDGAACFVSSDRSASKASGRLFDLLVRELGVQASAVVHIGDDAHSDGVMARHRGVHSVSAPEGRLNRYERLLAGSMWSTAGSGAAFSGASRLARLRTHARNGSERAIVDVAAGVAGPALVAYVLWILRRSQDCGVRRLAFVARDGQVLHDIATILIRRLRLPLSSTYLYASRQSTNLAATFDADHEELSWVFRDREYLTPRQLLERFDISWEEAAESLTPLGLAADQPGMTPEAADALADLLQRGSLRRLLLAKAAVRRSTVVDYLQQEGLLSQRCAVVDFGGVGSQVRALHRLIVTAGGPPPRMFLMSMDDPAEAGVQAGGGVQDWLADTECYLFDNRRGRGIVRPRGLVTVLQMFSAADHGTVTGYAREHGRVVPVLAHGTDKPLLAWGLPVLRDTIRCFTEHVVLAPDLVDPWTDLREPVTEVIREFWTNPTGDEARAWGTFPFEGAQAGGSTARPVAGRYTWRSVGAGLLQRSFPDLGWQHWYQGSRQLSPLSLRVPLRSAEVLYRSLGTSTDPRVGRFLRLVRRVLRG
jgi:FMN phosphatase YigB (HAD superfamily)